MFSVGVDCCTNLFCGHRVPSAGTHGRGRMGLFFQGMACIYVVLVIAPKILQSRSFLVVGMSDSVSFRIFFFVYGIWYLLLEGLQTGMSSFLI